MSENDKIVNTTIEILGKLYPIRCKEHELAWLNKAATELQSKMLSVQENGKTLSLERIAIITALNIMHEYLHEAEEKNRLAQQINRRLCQLQNQLDETIHRSLQTELFASE